MAIASTETLIPIDDWASFMGVSGWLFNQIYNSDIPLRGSSDKLWFQGHGISTFSSFVGREELADTMAQAEAMVANAITIWPGRTWIAAEDHEWEAVKRGYQINVPRYFTNWKHVYQFGVEAWEIQNLYPVTVTYVGNQATLSFATTITDPFEIVIVPLGCDPSETPCAIRPLNVTIDAGTCTVTGDKWLFLDQDYWEGIREDLYLHDNSIFIPAVEVYRHYTDTSQQAQYLWQGGEGCNELLCDETCQSACARLMDKKSGKMEAWPATYSGGTWSRAVWTYASAPTLMRIWYETRYADHTAQTKPYVIPRALVAAVVHLTNVYLPDSICGSDYTRQMFAEDREDSDVYDWSVATAMRFFGTTKKGAVKAAGLLSRLHPEI